METKTTSKAFLMISATGKTIRAHESKFEKNTGDTIELNGVKYYVFSLETSLNHAKVHLSMFDFDLIKESAIEILPEKVTSKF